MERAYPRHLFLQKSNGDPLRWMIASESRLPIDMGFALLTITVRIISNWIVYNLFDGPGARPSRGLAFPAGAGPRCSTPSTNAQY